MFINFCSMYYFIFIEILIFSLNLNVFAQVLRNSYSDIYRNDRESRQFPREYYEKYAPSDGSKWRNQQFQSTGLDFDFSDTRCIGDKNPNDAVVAPVKVITRLGTIIGLNASLCDGPGVPELDRPHLRPNYSPKINTSIAIFLGIPYAVPPINERRFKPPQVQPSFNSISARQYKSSCPQPIQFTGNKTGIIYTNEDCLYLNVFTPSVQYQSEKYAVMIYIHGGEWYHGSANTFPAHMLAASQNVVVVTFNYRLGPFGFYANGQNSSSGNYGLLDQAMAIEWVYDNIDAFNGDNTRITLFGPEVGAASAGIHALSTRLGKKIRRVIAQSGSAVADWAVLLDNYTIFNNSLEYASLFNCQFRSSWRTVNCLRGEPIYKFETIPFEPKVGWHAWGPVVDFCTREEYKRILPDSPENLIKYHYENLHGDFAYMTGVTKDEAAFMLFNDDDFRRFNFRITKEMFLKKIQEYSKIYNYTLDVPALTKAIEFMYMPRTKDINNETLLKDNYINMLSDSYFKASCDKMLKLLLQRNIKTYMYVLNSTLEGLKTVINNNLYALDNVVSHNTEYYLITGAPFMDPKLYPSHLNLYQARWTEADRNLSEFFMTSWANFAKYGDPTPTKVFDINWVPTTLYNMDYLSINTTNYTTVMLSGYRQRESEFWNNYIHILMKKEIMPPSYCRPVYEDWEDKKFVYEASLWGVLGAIALFLILSVICCTLYCQAKGKHVVSTEDIPDTISVAPSSIDTLLHMKRIEAGNRYYAERLHGEQKHTSV